MVRHLEARQLEEACRAVVEKMKFDCTINERLSKATEGQFNSVDYCKIRKGRLTSTKFYSVLSRRNKSVGEK